jgi:ParB/RepB/Spo0J family partition protein
LQRISISQIEESNLRAADETEDIRRSFSENGQISPIGIRRHPSKAGKYLVVYGNRRFRAAKALGWTTLAADIFEATDAKALKIAFCENSDRRDFSDYEKALLLLRMYETTGASFDEIARMIDKSPAFVSQHVAMLRLFPETIGTPEECKKILCALTENHARVLAKVENPTERWNTAKLAVRAKLGVRELQRLCYTKERKKSANRSKNIEIEELVREIVAGINSKNLSALTKSISPRSFSMFSSFPPLNKIERDGVANHLQTILSNLKEYEEIPDTLEIQTTGKMAFAVMTLKTKMKMKHTEISFHLRASMIFQKEEQWKLVHAHFSTDDPIQSDRFFKQEMRVAT